VVALRQVEAEITPAAFVFTSRVLENLPEANDVDVVSPRIQPIRPTFHKVIQ